MTMIIDVDKFVASLIKYYCEAHSIDRTLIRCWFDDILEEQGLEYKNGEIVKTQRRVAAEAKEAIFDDEDEKIRKDIIRILKGEFGYTSKADSDKYVAWLEKQKVADEEIIFRPVVGTDIRIAAKQALEKIEIGRKVVLAFNGAYILVNGKTVAEIDSEYDAWIEKQKDINVLIQEASEKAYTEGMRVEREHWLEKQDEQKPILDFKASNWYVSKVDGKIHDITYNSTDKVEPKFKFGDWIVNNNSKDVFLIKSTNSGYCTLESIKGNIIFPCLPPCESESHIWTIQDVGDGDVLYSPTHHLIWIYKDDKHYYVCINLNYTSNNISVDGSISIPNDVCPATKEQRDTLFKAIKDAGYEWDAEKKELKNVEQKPIKMWHDVSEVPDEMQELLVEWESPDATWHSVAFYDAETKTFRHLKKPIENVTHWAYVSDILSQSETKISDKGWSEKDEEILKNLIDYFSLDDCLRLPTEETIDWLKTLKDRLKGE